MSEVFYSTILKNFFADLLNVCSKQHPSSRRWPDWNLDSFIEPAESVETLPEIKAQSEHQEFVSFINLAPL